MRTRDTKTWMAMLLALASSGCGNGPVDLGDDRAPAVVGASLSDYQGVWVGYAELAEWSDGTADVRLELDAQGNGTLEVGQAPPLEPPVVDDSYPPQFDWTAMGPWPTGLYSGFSYPVAGARVESARIRLETHSGELFREFCDIQTPTPVPGSPETFNCRGFTITSTSGAMCWTSSETDNEWADCNPLMCVNLCRCTESECVPMSLDAASDVRLDAELSNDGEELVGSFAVPRPFPHEPMVYRVLMQREGDAP